MAICLSAVAGCSTDRHEERGDPFARLALPSSALPKHVSLAPWTGSDKLRWRTSNPFRSTNQQILSKFEQELPVEKGILTEVYLAAYWVGKPDDSPVEIHLAGLRFSNPAIATQAAKALQPTPEEIVHEDSHVAPLVIHRGTIVCVLSPSSAVDKAVWSVMVRLVEDAVTDSP